MEKISKKVFDDNYDNKLKKPTKKSSKEDSSEEESVENLILNDSSSDEEPENFFKGIIEEAGVEKMDEQPINEGDFVLVELASKKSKRYYAAKVVKLVLR